MMEFYFGLRVCFRLVAFWPHVILWEMLSNVKQMRTFHHNKMFHVLVINHFFPIFPKMAKMFEIAPFLLKMQNLNYAFSEVSMHISCPSFDLADLNYF